MIKEFVERWEENKDKIQAVFREAHPFVYDDIVRIVIENITTGEYKEYAPDPERIHCIDDGDYQGTLLYVIGEKGYQPSKYYACYVGYGSCSGCDTLQSIKDYSDGPPTEEQANEYTTLALHIVQGLKEI